MTLPALEITGLLASENDTPILHGVNLHVAAGEAVALLGHRGEELTATLRAVLGQNPRRHGSILIHGVESIEMDTHAVSHLGVAACPTRPDVVSGLTCEENLLLPLPLEGVLGGGLSLTEVYELFPALRHCRAAPAVNLDEAEQQMLAVARVLRSGANLLLFDQICAGLPGPAVRNMGRTITALKSLGYSILLTERNPDFPTEVADRSYLLKDGVAQELMDLDGIPTLAALPAIASSADAAQTTATVVPPALEATGTPAVQNAPAPAEPPDIGGIPLLTPAYADPHALTDALPQALP